jgi:hypothetical protein
MTETTLVEIQPLADLLDSRQDLREILARNLNLAHACLLLRRGESEDVEKALELALRQADPDTSVVAECIRVELLRLAGDLPQALSRSEALARSQRFHPAAALYLRNLFPLIDPVHNHVADSVVQEIPPHADAGDDESVDSLDSREDRDSQAHAMPFEESAPPSPAGDQDVPPAWQSVAVDDSVVLLRLRFADGLREKRNGDLAVGALEDLALVRSGQILSRLGFGELRHAAFDGEVRVVHAWSENDRSALIVMSSGGSASLLAARCTKAFQVNP